MHALIAAHIPCTLLFHSPLGDLNNHLLLQSPDLDKEALYLFQHIT